MADIELTKSNFVVLPRFIGNDRKFYVRLVRLDEHGKLTEAMHSFSDDKVTARLFAGNVYEIGHNDRSFDVLGARWLHEFNDQQLVELWQAQQIAFRAEKARLMREKKENTSDGALERRLAPLRLAYQRLAAPERLGFEVWVLSVLRRKS